MCVYWNKLFSKQCLQFLSSCSKFNEKNEKFSFLTFDKCNKKKFKEQNNVAVYMCHRWHISFFFYCRPVNPYGQHFKYQNVVFLWPYSKIITVSSCRMKTCRLSFASVWPQTFASSLFLLLFDLLSYFTFKHLFALKCQQHWIMQTCLHSIAYKSVYAFAFSVPPMHIQPIFPIASLSFILCFGRTFSLSLSHCKQAISYRHKKITQICCILSTNDLC